MVGSGGGELEGKGSVNRGWGSSWKVNIHFSKILSILHRWILSHIEEKNAW
jgi:hypothetical protein